MRDPGPCIVIGGGVMGLGIAAELAREGVDVTVFERDACGRAASYAAAGMLAPLAELEPDEEELHAFALASQREWPRFAARLRDASDIDVELDTTGTLIVALERDDVARLEPLRRQHRRLQVRSSWLEPEACRELEPLLSPQVVGALHCPEDIQVSNRRLVEALREAATRCGVRIREKSAVEEVHVHAGEVAGVRCADGASHTAKSVVVAAGAWSRRIAGLGAQRPPVRPVRGQMLALQTEDDCPPPRHVLRGPEAYLVPKRDGRIVVGATSEERGFDDRMTGGGVLELLRGAWEILPLVWEMPLLDLWCGFRPGSRDNAPLLGGCDVAGLHFATGHYRNGIQQCPITIEAVAAAVMGRTMPEVALPFHAARFVRP